MADLFKDQPPGAIERVTHVEATLEPLTPAMMPELMRLAVEKGGVEALERLAALHERMMAQQAAREFAGAMAAFQQACPPIRKTSKATVTTKSGSQYTYDYAELDEIAKTVGPHLHREGLSYSWDSAVSDDGKRLTTTCRVSHANGHSASASFTSPTAAATSSMSPQQEVAAALTFGRRQSLVQALGLTTCDPSYDGGAPASYVTPDQVTVLADLIDRCPPGTGDRMMKYVGVTTLDAIQAGRFQELKRGLEEKLKGAK